MLANQETINLSATAVDENEGTTPTLMDRELTWMVLSCAKNTFIRNSEAKMPMESEDIKGIVINSSIYITPK